jgi:hypothetical protein
MSNITDADVSILMNQCGINQENAREVLLLNRGDLVKSIIELESGEIKLEKLDEIKKERNKIEEEETLDFEVDTSKQDNLNRYREIVDNKDEIYNKNKIEKEKREQKQKENEERRARGEEVEEEKPEFSAEELYAIKRGTNSFNSIRVL